MFSNFLNTKDFNNVYDSGLLFQTQILISATPPNIMLGKFSAGFLKI